MSKNWYSSSWTGGTSGNSSNCYNDDNKSDGYEYGGENNDYNQSYGYAYGGEDFSISNNGENFSGNRGGFNLGYGATENNGNLRRNYQPRYGEGAISSYREDYGGNFRGGHEQRYGVDARSNDRSNYRGNCEQNHGENVRSNDRSRYRGNLEQNYGENVRSKDRSNDEQRYGENGRYCANYSDNFRGGFKPSFEDNAGDSHCGINSTGNNIERYDSHERRTDSNWTGHYSGYEDEYIEKDMKEESGRIKRELKEESFDKANKDSRIKKEVKLELDYTREVTAGGFKVNNLKDDVDIKKELQMKKEMNIAIEKNEDSIGNLGRLKEMTSQERAQNNVKKGIIKTEMAEKNVPENNEKHNIIKEKASNFAEKQAQEYACLKPECLATFQVWGYARSHMQQGCLPTKMTKKGSRLAVKPNIEQSREKAKKQREMGTAMLKGVAADNEEKLVEAARNFYAEKQNLGQYPTHSEVAWHLRDNYRGFGLPPARIHQIVTSLSKHDR